MRGLPARLEPLALSLLVSLLGGAAPVEDAGEFPELHLVTKLPVAPGAELRDDAAAGTALADLLSQYAAAMEKVRKAPPGPDLPPEEQIRAVVQANARFRQLNVAFLRSVIKFTQTYSTTRAALKAELVLARIIGRHFRTPKGVVAARVLYREIADKCPQYDEGVLAKLQMLEHDLRDSLKEDIEKGITDDTPRPKVHECLLKIREQIAAAKPSMQSLDKDRSQLGLAFRAIMLSSREGSFAGRSKMLLAATAEQLGEITEAKRIYEEVLREFPNSPHAKDALLSIRCLRTKERLDVPKK